MPWSRFKANFWGLVHPYTSVAQAQNLGVMLDSSLTAPSNPWENPADSVLKTCHSYPHPMAQTTIFSHMGDCHLLSLCLHVAPHWLPQKDQAHSCFILCGVLCFRIFTHPQFPLAQCGTQSCNSLKCVMQQNWDEICILLCVHMHMCACVCLWAHIYSLWFQLK